MGRFCMQIYEFEVFNSNALLLLTKFQKMALEICIKKLASIASDRGMLLRDYVLQMRKANRDKNSRPDPYAL